jgi:hypothetical protein
MDRVAGKRERNGYCAKRGSQGGWSKNAIVNRKVREEESKDGIVQRFYFFG